MNWHGISYNGMLFLTVCGGAFLWAVLIVVRKIYLDRHKVNEDLVVVATMLGAATLCSVVEVITNRMGVTKISSAVWWPLLITAVINVGIQYWSVLALKLEDASIVAPLSATMPLWVIFLSYILLGEYPTVWGKIGIVVVGLGAYLVRLESTGVKMPEWLERIVPAGTKKHVSFYCGPWIRLWTSKGARLALLVALLGAVSINFDKLAVIHSSPMFLTVGCFYFVALFVFGWSKMSGRWKGFDKRMFWPLFCWGMVFGVALILMNAGFLFGIVPYVGSLKRTQILWTVILSGFLLKEKNILMRVIAALLIFSGAVAMMF